jgi:hypothetical protein
MIKNLDPQVGVKLESGRPGGNSTRPVKQRNVGIDWTQEGEGQCPIRHIGPEYTSKPIREILFPVERDEWGRHQSVFQRFGIRRGTLYNLTAEGKVKSVTLRRKGNRHGCRLWHLQSIREHLNSLMAQQNDGGARE